MIHAEECTLIPYLAIALNMLECLHFLVSFFVFERSALLDSE